ncbi:hypothetical protein DOY81_007447 [Sarcophaga bullata]|nr:hypothetical protein DOY81_007447 [Sarcophaga bullata]
MFTFRFKSYRFSQYLLLIALMVLVSSGLSAAGSTQKKCAEFNEYCLNHWDCCSNSCMSYLYRCTRGYNVYPYPFLGVSYKPTVTLDQILQQNFGDPIPQPAAKPQPQPQTYINNRFAEIDNSEQTTSSAEITIVLQNSSPETTTKIPVFVENRLDEAAATNEIKQTESVAASTTTTTTTDGNRGCLEIGAKVNVTGTRSAVANVVMDFYINASHNE